MSNRNFAQRYPKHIKQFIKDGKWYGVNIRTNMWHCRYHPDQETKDRLVKWLLMDKGVHGIKKIEDLHSYSRIFS